MPSNLNELIPLVSFLLPGFITIILFFYQVSEKRKPELETIIFSVLCSIILGFFTNLIFLLINAITNLRLNLKNDGYGFTVVSITFGIIFSVILARFFKSKFFGFINKKLFGITTYPFGRLWNKFLDLPPNTVLKIFLNNEIVYVGILKRFSIDPDDDKQEIELSSPVYFNPQTNQFKPITETENILISRESIVAIEKIDEKEAKKIYKLL